QSASCHSFPCPYDPLPSRIPEACDRSVFRPSHGFDARRVEMAGAAPTDDEGADPRRWMRRERHMARTTGGRWRSVGAVFAGLLLNVVLATAIDAVLHATGVYPPPGQPMSHALFLVATGYRLAIGVASGFLTARLAPARPM